MLENNPELWAVPARITAGLSAALGFVGLLLASMGVYGVMSYAVAQRTREIGIRITLGARQRDVSRLVLGQSMRPVLVGVAIGLAGSAVMSKVLTSLLFGVSPARSAGVWRGRAVSWFGRHGGQLRASTSGGASGSNGGAAGELGFQTDREI